MAPIEFDKARKDEFSKKLVFSLFLSYDASMPSADIIFRYLVIFALSLKFWSCASSPATPIARTELFVCGCDPCARLTKSIRDDLKTNSVVYFKGSYGDARAFQDRFKLPCTVRADLDGSISKSRGLSVCPSFVILRPFDQRTTVLGNGKAIDAQELRSIRDSLQGGHPG